MKKKLLTIILVIIGITVTFINPILAGLCSIATWIYLVWMLRKQKNNALRNQTGQEIAIHHLKNITKFLIVSGLSFLVFVFSNIMHIVQDGMSESHETTYYFISLASLFVFIFTTAGGMVIFLKKRKKIELC